MTVSLTLFAEKGTLKPIASPRLEDTSCHHRILTFLINQLQEQSANHPKTITIKGRDLLNNLHYIFLIIHRIKLNPSTNMVRIVLVVQDLAERAIRRASAPPVEHRSGAWAVDFADSVFDEAFADG